MKKCQIFKKRYSKIKIIAFIILRILFLQSCQAWLKICFLDRLLVFKMFLKWKVKELSSLETVVSLRWVEVYYFVESSENHSQSL